MTSKRLSRRTLLRGAAGGITASIALPPLAAQLDGSGTAYADGTEIPRKYMTWFFGGGVHVYYGDKTHLEKWAPLTTGAGWQPNALTAPLADPALKPYVNILTGMNSKTTPYAHQGGYGVLCGSPAVLADGITPARNGQGGVRPMGRSLDQILANSAFGRATRFKSIDISTDNFYPSDGGTTILSQDGLGGVTYPERDPRKTMAKLFGVQVAAGAADPANDVRRSMLDAVLSDVQTLKGTIGAEDRRRIDEYLESLRSLERRAAQTPTSCKGPTSVADVTDTDVKSINYTKLNQIWTELAGIALACDLTRVVSYAFTRPGTDARFGEIGTRGIHWLQHNTPAPQAELARALTFQIVRLAESAKILQRIRVGAGSLLDHICLLATSELSRGYDHDTRDWPLVLIGKAGGGLKIHGHWHRAGDDLDRVGYSGSSQITVDRQGAPGDYRNTADDNLSRVGLTVLHAMGLRPATFGHNAGNFPGTVSKPITEFLSGS